MTQFTIRPANNGDTGEVLAFCHSDLSDGNVNEAVWDAWLHDSNGVLMVAVRDEHPIGTAHVAFLNAHEAWFEGVYVTEDERGQGIGRELLRYSIATSQQHGAEVVRTSVMDANTSARVLVQHAGFAAIGTYDTFSAATTGVKSDNRTRPYLNRPGSDMLDVIWQWLEHSSLVTLTGGLLLQNGRGLALTDELLEYHLHSGNVWTLSEWDRFQGLCIASPYTPIGQTVPHDFTILYLDGTPESIGRIAYSLRDIAQEADIPLVTAHPPQILTVQDALSGAGFTRTTDAPTALFVLSLV